MLFIGFDLEFGANACKVNINSQLGDPQPLYLYPDDSFVEIDHLEKTTGFFHIKSGGIITVFCEHEFDGRPGKRLEVTCVKDNIFKPKGKPQVEIGLIKCSKKMVGSTRRIKDTSRTCLGGSGEMAEIGFYVGAVWKPIMEVCHNPADASSKWAHYIIDPMNSGFQKNVERDIKFSLGNSGFYESETKNKKGEKLKMKVDLFYKKEEQRNTFSSILPLGMKTAMELVPKTGDQYLARGHLAANVDQIFGAHQSGTFFFINVAPQWQSFNAGNWYSLEKQLRTFITGLGHRAEVYTGTHGIMKHKGVELYLYINKNTKKLPVPKIFYKIVIVHSLKKAIVFIGVNNPLVTDRELKNEYKYCTDISNKLPMVFFTKDQRNNAKSGVMTVCEIGDFLNNLKMKNEGPNIAKKVRQFGLLEI